MACKGPWGLSACPYTEGDTEAQSTLMTCSRSLGMERPGRTRMLTDRMQTSEASA